GACDFQAVRNVDYHPAGAKGSDHRGHQTSRWADLVVPTEDAAGAPAWETKAWREARKRAAQGRAGPRPRPAMPDAVPLPEPVAGGAGGAPGEGNADEWLGAVPSSLAPAPATPPPAQRIRLRYRKLGPARFIGAREIGNVFLRAARRARLPLAFSQGHHPMPRLSFSPAIPLGFSSDDEYVDLDLTAATPPETVAHPPAAAPLPRAGGGARGHGQARRAPGRAPRHPPRGGPDASRAQGRNALPRRGRLTAVAKQILINVAPWETRVALLEDTTLVELHIERRGGGGIAGNIYKGKVLRVLPGMQAAFIDIGLPKAAFLHASDVGGPALP